VIFFTIFKWGICLPEGVAKCHFLSNEYALPYEIGQGVFYKEGKMRKKTVRRFIEG
jgi:hypothetical protein